MTIQRAIAIANLTFIALGAYLTAGLFYKVVGFGMQPSVQQVVTEKRTISRKKGIRQKPISAYKAIEQRDLFKTKQIKAPATNTKIDDTAKLSQTKLQLKLWGTVTENTEHAYAVIEDTKKREQNLYRTGDDVQGATVKRILKDKVVLTRNGKDEQLKMEEMRSGSKSRVVAGRSSRSSSRARSRSSSGVRKQRVSLRREMINNAIQDVSKLMTQVKIRPKMGEDGQQEGLSMSNIKPNSIFRRMGLRNGDVLKSVDGQQIQSVDDALKLYESLKSANSVAVDIQRRGRDRTIEYNIR